MSEDEEKKKNRTNFYWGVVKVCAGYIRHGLLKHFASWDIETFWAQNL